MKCLSRILPVVGLGLTLTGVPAGAQQPSAAAKPPSPAAVAAAKEILDMKNVGAMYAHAVPRIVQKTKDTLIASNLNYQKDLDEVAVIVARKFAGREQEVGAGMANIYAGEFTEQELKDLVAFYKSPLGHKLLTTEPNTVQMSMAYMNRWAQSFADVVNAEFRAEMRKRGKTI